MAREKSQDDKIIKRSRQEIISFRNDIGSRNRYIKDMTRAEKWIFLKDTYASIERWRKSGQLESILEYSKKQVTTSKKSSDFLVVLRYIFRNSKNKKLMSAWASVLEYANHEEIESDDFLRFLIDEGGINSTGGKMTEVREKAKAKKGKRPSASAPL
jgi:hypothetical protein